ncbi:MAG: imidazoleglycerol-phosphate dehydratase HisB [Ruminococcus sp.]|jgi:imidazoleglycerol-phosphate dehydratase|nr:imidazoleglycerol-phosphate dehydratase HisB [Ruminococcus sp.]
MEKLSRTAEISRKTRETDITAKINLDGKGISEINTGVGFFDHMLTAFSRHSGIDIELEAKGDLIVDPHHTVEDTGIVLGQVFKNALGEGKGIARYGSAFIPMDEALGFCAVDISNRPYLVFEAAFMTDKTGEFDNCLTEEFFRAFSVNAGLTLHLKSLYGKNDHHIIEALFKSLAHALKAALVINSDEILSTKGVI